MQLRPVEFKVVAANSATECEKQVNALLDQDWVMHGDLKVNFDPKGEVAFIQAMARVEMKPPPGFDKMATSSIAIPSSPIIGR